MLTTELEAHTEQMEATRAEFVKLWEGELKPLFDEWHIDYDECEQKAVEHLCWIAFRKATQLVK